MAKTKKGPKGPIKAKGPREQTHTDLMTKRRPPVSGALLSHGLTPQYHRRWPA